MSADSELAARIAEGLPPYAISLGMNVARIEHGSPVLEMAFDPKVEGRPGFLHGGAIGGLLEMAAFTALRAELIRRHVESAFKPVNVTVEFQRAGLPQATFAIGRVTRAGRRIANISAEAWQDDPAKPIATAWMNVLLG